MTVEAIEMVLEDVLEQASSLAADDRVSSNGLEISIGSAGVEHLHLPFPFRIIRVPVRIYFRGHVVDSHFLPLRHDVKESWGSHRFSGTNEDLVGRLIEIGHSIGLAANDLEMIVVITSIKCQEEPSRNRITK